MHFQADAGKSMQESPMAVYCAAPGVTSTSAGQVLKSAIPGWTPARMGKVLNVYAHQSWGINNLFVIVGSDTARGTLVPLLMHGGRCTSKFVAALSFVYAMPVLADGDYLKWCCSIKPP